MIHIYTSLIDTPGTSQVGMFLTQRASENLHVPCGALCGIFFLSLFFWQSLFSFMFIILKRVARILFKTTFLES